MPRRWRVPRPMRFPSGYEKVTFHLPEELLDDLDEQSDKWVIGPNKIIEVAVEAAVAWLVQNQPPGRRLGPVPRDSLNAAVASAMMEAMDPIRTVPSPGAISDVSGEDIPEGPEPDYPEADAAFREGHRPETQDETNLLLDI